MITMKIKVDEALTRALNDLPAQVQYKCLDPAARKMASPIVRASQAVVQPDSSSTSGTQRWARKPGIAPKEKWSKSVRDKFDTGPSAKHVVSKYWKTQRGGILYVGMKATGDGEGKKMHFRLPVLKKNRTLYYWGKPGQIITQKTRNQRVITYTRGAPKKKTGDGPVIPAGSKIDLERAHFLKRAYQHGFNQAFSLFKTEFYKKAKELRLG